MAGYGGSATAWYGNYEGSNLPYFKNWTSLQKNYKKLHIEKGHDHD
jgi:hypothetical protein